MCSVMMTMMVAVMDYRAFELLPCSLVDFLGDRRVMRWEGGCRVCQGVR